MKNAIERSNALYKALADFIQDGDGLYMPRDVVHEEIDNFLDDIFKAQDALKLDLTTLGDDLAHYLNEEYFSQYPAFFSQRTEYDCGTEAYIQMWPKYKQAVKLLSEAIMEVGPDRFDF